MYNESTALINNEEESKGCVPGRRKQKEKLSLVPSVTRSLSALVQTNNNSTQYIYESAYFLIRIIVYLWLHCIMLYLQNLDFTIHVFREYTNSYKIKSPLVHIQCIYCITDLINGI